MKCDEVRPLLVAMVDGELPASDAESVREHRARCPACRAAEGNYRAILAASAPPRTGADREHALSVQLAVALHDLALLRAEVRALAAEVAALREPALETRPRGLGLIVGGQQAAQWESLGIV